MTAITRRRALGQTAALSLLSVLGPGCTHPSEPSANPFTLGVASGDPLPDGVVLWTRLAPDPLNGGGMPDAAVAVHWEVAADDGMRQIVRKGAADALPENAHAVHVEVGGLEPGRWYWYRFDAHGHASAVGRTRTAPSEAAPLERLRLAVACCQNYQHGYYTAYRHMAAEDLDLVLHVGDYIYEGGIKAEAVRRHNSDTVSTLAAYRNRYALYKLDPDLQAAHAAFPWAAVPDDHEVFDDYAGGGDAAADGPGIARRRAAAYQAYYEHLPFRASSLPRGPHMHLHRTLRYGDLAAIHLLDTRQFRTAHPCGKGWSPRCPADSDPAATMLGAGQERWLYEKFAAAGRWTVLAQQVPVIQRRRPRDGVDHYNDDKWDGYRAARGRLFGAAQKHGVDGLVALSGDVHNNWAGALKADFDDPQSVALGAEFVATSISSNGDGADSTKGQRNIVEANPHIAFYNGQRGYLRCEVGREAWRTDFRVVPFVAKPGAPIATRASVVAERASGRLTVG